MEYFYHMQDTTVLPGEAQYVDKRQVEIKKQWPEYLKRIGRDASVYSEVPVIAIATR